jgi:POT family proton-dependent oligopeptide transporter
MVTKLAPANMTGVIMGAWFLSISCANYLAGVLSALAGTLDEDALEKGEIPKDAALAAYQGTYELIFWYALGAGVLLLLFAKPINKLMHGVK